MKFGMAKAVSLACLCLGAAAATGLAGCGGHGAEAPLSASTAPRAMSVTVAPMVIRKVERTVDVVGTLKGWESVTVGTKRVCRGQCRGDLEAGMGETVRQAAVVGEEDQARGVDVEPAHGIQPGRGLDQADHRRPALRV